MKYAHPDDVEKLIQKFIGQTGKSDEEIRPMVLEVLKTNGYVVAIPIEHELQAVSVRAGEEAVIQNLKRMQEGRPHQSHTELLSTIRMAQVRARENVVVNWLRDRGLIKPKTR